MVSGPPTVAVMYSALVVQPDVVRVNCETTYEVPPFVIEKLPTGVLVVKPLVGTIRNAV